MKKVILILCLINLTACIDFRTLEKWDDARVKKKYERAREAYYAKETPEQKRLRKINRKICFDVSGAYSGSWDQSLFRDCMKERGSPLP